MQSGDYKRFLAENQRDLSTCRTSVACDIILLNLGFVYAYPHSPLRNPQKARQYLQELQQKFPHSPWVPQGQMLLAFLNERVSLEDTQRQLRNGLRSRDAAIRKLREQLDRSREIDIEIEQQERQLLP
jgi:hypothetical protein